MVSPGRLVQHHGNRSLAVLIVDPDEDLASRLSAFGNVGCSYEIGKGILLPLGKGLRIQFPRR
jgi:hypothetical protein